MYLRSNVNLDRALIASPHEIIYLQEPLLMMMLEAFSFELEMWNATINRKVFSVCLSWPTLYCAALSPFGPHSGQVAWPSGFQVLPSQRFLQINSTSSQPTHSKICSSATATVILQHNFCIGLQLYRFFEPPSAFQKNRKIEHGFYTYTNRITQTKTFTKTSKMIIFLEFKTHLNYYTDFLNFK